MTGARLRLLVPVVTVLVLTASCGFTDQAGTGTGSRTTTAGSPTAVAAPPAGSVQVPGPDDLGALPGDESSTVTPSGCNATDRR